MASESGAAIEVTTEFNPLAFLLYFCTPTIEIDGVPHRRPWGRHSFPVSPGPHTVRVYFRYLFLPEAGASRLEVDAPPGVLLRIRFYMPPWMFARGSMRELDPAAAPGSAVATKRCPRCAEDVRLEALVCRHCGHEFEEASIATERAKYESDQAAARERVAERREGGKQLELFHRHRRSLAWTRVCFITAGIFLLLSLSGVIVASSGARPSGPGDPLQLSLGYAVAGGLLLAGGFSLRRKSRLAHEALLARVESEGERYRCRCGRPKYPYHWLHVAVCFLFPYGLVVLLFPSKKCRDCGTRYDEAGQAA